MAENIGKAWEDFLNPDRMRSHLISASIYIAAYESLKDAIISRPKEMYWTGWSKDEGDIIDERYKSEVLSRNSSVLYASLDWLREHGALTSSDVCVLDRVKNCRNLLAHRLFSFLGNEGLPPEFEKCFSEMVELLNKVEKWWIVNVEIPCDPDMCSKDVDVEGIIPGRIMVIRLLCDIALGSEKESKYYYEEFKKRHKSRDG
jgi:hypothetical protein